MKDFIDILTHGRKLQGAVKALSTIELEDVCNKIYAIIEKRKAREAKLIEAQKEKQKRIEEIKKSIEEAGLDISDFQPTNQQVKRQHSGKKRPIKYKLVDANGYTTSWSGIGRMPKVFKQAIDSGDSLDTFKI